MSAPDVGSEVIAGRPVRAVIFDRDGVLVRFDLEFLRAFFEPLLPIPLSALSNHWRTWCAQRRGPQTLDEERAFWSGFWDMVFGVVELDDDVRRRLRAFDYATALIPFSDAEPALRLAHSMGLRVGVLSNFPLSSLEQSLEHVGLARFIHAFCASAAIGASKPDPASYMAVCRALEVEPAECVFFDDEAPCVAGARAVGMNAFLIDRKRPDHALSEGVLRGLDALEAVLDRRSSELEMVFAGPPRA
ncbi:MAG: HAD family hydrolase [Polyangiaceae bacterium]|nr:HAD family hydrolase [Polyangiaceae bacterium]